MESTEHLFPWLNLIDRPAFCVKDDAIIACNAAAQSRMLRVGTDVKEIIAECLEDYLAFNSGSLFLTVHIGGLPCNASIHRTQDCDIFVLEQDADAEHLQVLALAAQQLRNPLSNVMTVSDRLLADLTSADNSAKQQASQLQRGLFQLLRIVSNMSDSGIYKESVSAGMEMTNLTALFYEVIDKAQTASERTGIRFAFTKPENPVLGLANPERLERAIYNILSNAIKFSPAGSIVDIKLVCNRSRLSFAVCNTNSEPVTEQSFWNRYHREPAIEENRHGLGLGMTLISAVATAHGGTVLIDHPDSQSTRVTMTIAVTKNNGDSVRSPVMRISDYAGGRDKALLELSELLPTDAYDNI